jgi:hypothetical protein
MEQAKETDFTVGRGAGARSLATGASAVIARQINGLTVGTRRRRRARLKSGAHRAGYLTFHSEVRSTTKNIFLPQILSLD